MLPRDNAVTLEEGNLPVTASEVTLNARVLSAEDTLKNVKSFLGRTDSVILQTDGVIEDTGITFEDDDDDANAPWYSRRKLRRIIEGLAVRVFTFLLLFIYIGASIYNIASPYDAFIIIDFCISMYFMIEVSVRLYALGPYDYFHSWYNLVDFIVVVCTLIVAIVNFTFDIEGRAWQSLHFVVVLRFLRYIRLLSIVRLWTEKENVLKGVRHVVSQNKRRYQKDGFDLDLTYVTERVIAMSFPSSGTLSFYRNPISEVYRFFETKYPGHYKIYNLCSERAYDPDIFHGKVERYIMDDHNVPTVSQMVEFSKSIRQWLGEDPENIVAVHCKGGKGRTGTMICVYMVDTNFFNTAELCLDYFGKRRTDLSVGQRFQGVETPSQVRYVEYFQKVKMLGGIPYETPLCVKEINIGGLRNVGKGDGSDFKVVIHQVRKYMFEANFGKQRNCQVKYNAQSDVLNVTLLDCPVLKGDVRLLYFCSSRSVLKGYEDCAFFYWFHTGFIEDNRLFLRREELDNPHKEKRWKCWGPEFYVETLFEAPPHMKPRPHYSNIRLSELVI